MAKRFRCVGRVTGSHGTRGEVVFCPRAEHPLALSKGLSVVLVPPTFEDSREKRVRCVRETEKGVLVAFEGISDLSGSSRCVGRSVLVAESDLPLDWELQKSRVLFAGEDPTGYVVVDQLLGELGRVRAFVPGEYQDILEVEGPFGNVLVPALAPIVRGVGKERIYLDCPPGLVELGGGSEKP